MVHKLVLQLAPLATPRNIRWLIVGLTLLAAFAAPHGVQAEPLGGGCGG